MAGARRGRRRVDVADGHLESVGMQGMRDGRAQTLRAARDESDAGVRQAGLAHNK
jgi:hypothetical protein